MTLSLEQQLTKARIVPVVTPYTAEGTVEVAKAMLAGGIGSIEITLRTPAAIDALIAVKEAGLDMLVGVGTATNAHDIHKVSDIGVDFAVSPGVTPKILDAARETNVKLLPGVSGPSDILLGFEYGLDLFKLFPAGALGGEKMLKALHGPFPDIKFCPTGGVSPSNIRDFLSLPNVICVGGSWMVPADLVKSENWEEITRVSSEAMSLISDM